MRNVRHKYDFLVSGAVAEHIAKSDVLAKRRENKRDGALSPAGSKMDWRAWERNDRMWGREFSFMTDANFRWPSPANLRPQTPPRVDAAPTPVADLQSALPRLLGCETFRLDGDLKLALQDMQSTSGIEWQQWLGQIVNEALRHYLGQ